MTPSPTYEWGAGNAERDRQRAHRDRMVDLLKAHGGSLTPREMADRLGETVPTVVARAQRARAYFRLEKQRDTKSKTVRVWLHEDLLRWLVGAA